MTPKEKAVELFNKMYQAKDILFQKKMDKYQAKQCALIAVDEILDVLFQIFESYEERIFWQEVKQEIEKL